MKKEKITTDATEDMIIPPPVTTTTANVEIKSPIYLQQFERNKKAISDKEEYELLKERILVSKNEGKRELHHRGDLRDFAWQTLSQEGYRLNRSVNENNPNDINFIIRW